MNITWLLFNKSAFLRMVVRKFSGSEFQTLPLSGRFFVSLDTHRPTYDMYVCVIKSMLVNGFTTAPLTLQNWDT